MADLDYTAEEWRTIPDAPDYSVSDMGRVRRDTPRADRTPTGILKPSLNRGKYLYVDLCTPNGQRKMKVHRLVLLAFVGPPPSDKPLGAHGNGNSLDNRLGNLRWASNAENCADKRLHGRVPDQRGQNSARTKLTDAEAAEIKSAKRAHGVCKELAARFGVSRGVIRSIRQKNGGNWRHV